MREHAKSRPPCCSTLEKNDAHCVCILIILTSNYNSRKERWDIKEAYIVSSPVKPMTICSSRFSFWCLLLTLCLPKLAARCHRARGAPGLSLFKSNQLGSFFELLAGALTPVWPPISDNLKSRGSTRLFNGCSRPRPLSLGVTKHVLTMFLAGLMLHRAPEDQTRKSELTACVG